jgi:DNA primase
VKYTRLTGQALFYKEENSLVHKLLAIEEEEGARDASYSIRTSNPPSTSRLPPTGKDPVTGKLRTEEYRVKGPVALMITTTEVCFDDETTNRFITLTIDESKEMTERILKRQREERTLEGLKRKPWPNGSQPNTKTPSVCSVRSRSSTLTPPISLFPPSLCGRGATTKNISA